MIDYAIIGGGRLARHFSEYFHLLEIPHTRWVRDRRSRFNTFDLPDTEIRLRETLKQADRVLLLVADNAIAALLKQYPFLHDKQLIHCSGALSLPGVAGAHPLMTFADHLYGLDVYQSVPFVLEAGYRFNDLLPGLPNPHFAISAQDKARYHAMCVMAGNFTQVLWKGISDRFEQQFGWPDAISHAYLKQVTSNFIQNPATALTGPLVRNDQQTIERNIKSLDGDPLQDLYHAFIRFYQHNEGHRPASEQAQMEQLP
jgi:predicted short-subunit dehydrogenase-like oxidoreductase (DUF2520 family)